MSLCHTFLKFKLDLITLSDTSHQCPLMLLLLASLCCLVTLFPAGLLLSALGPFLSLLFPPTPVRASSCRDTGSPFPPPLSSCIFGRGLALYSPSWKMGPSAPFCEASFVLLVCCSHFSTRNLFPPRASFTFTSVAFPISTPVSSVLISTTFSAQPSFPSLASIGARLFSISASTF